MSDTASAPIPALGICLEEYEYPYPVRFLPLSSDLQPVLMAYGDIPPSAEPNGKAVVLMHGKAFGGYYFRNVIEALTGTSRTSNSPARSSPSCCRFWPSEPHSTAADAAVRSAPGIGSASGVMIQPAGASRQACRNV
jgi:hypothetical protein